MHAKLVCKVYIMFSPIDTCSTTIDMGVLRPNAARFNSNLHII